MFKVTIVDKWNGKLQATTYSFDNIQQHDKFIELCQGDEGIMIIPHKNKIYDYRKVS